MGSVKDAVLERAQMVDVLEILGISAPKPKQHIRCPLPGHPESTASFNIWLPSGKGFRCFGCGAHGGILQLPVLLGIVKNEAAVVSLLAQKYGIQENRMPEGSSFRRKENQRTHRPLAPTSLSQEKGLEDKTVREIETILQDCLPLRGTEGAKYLKGRGFECDAAEACGVIFHPNWYRKGPAVIFKVIGARGEIVALVGRFTGPTEGAKAMNLGQVSLGVFSTPGALEMAKDGAHGPVAICEAPLDAIAHAVSGMPALALCGVGVPEWGKSRQWVAMKLAGKPVCLAFDEDEAGHKAAQAMKEVLSPFGGLITHVSFDGAKDAAELLQRDSCKLYEMVQDRQSYIREQYWKLSEPNICELSLARDLAEAKGTLLGQNRFEVVELPFAA